MNESIANIIFALTKGCLWGYSFTAALLFLLSQLRLVQRHRVLDLLAALNVCYLIGMAAAVASFGYFLLIVWQGGTELFPRTKDAWFWIYEFCFLLKVGAFISFLFARYRISFAILVIAACLMVEKIHFRIIGYIPPPGMYPYEEAFPYLFFAAFILGYGMLVWFKQLPSTYLAIQTETNKG